VRVDALAVRLRRRAPLEAADFGVRLAQASAPEVYRCYLAVAMPVAVLALASFEIASWLPAVVVWWSKPWLDRPILFVLSRAAFGQTTTLGDLIRAQRHVLWGQLPSTFTRQRLSLWRSFTLPVYMLEGLARRGVRARVRQVRSRHMLAASLMTQAFYMAESGLTAALVSLVFWFAPAERAPDPAAFFSGDAPALLGLVAVAYLVAVLFLEPFYVGAGFGMYLNRRAELEAWDIEQDFRRAFAR
jgi:hypothetical protein